MAGSTLTAARHRLYVVLTVPALVLILVAGVGILHHRAWRVDLTPEQRYTLSERGRRVAAALPRGARLRAFLRVQDPRNPMLRDLVRQLEVAAPGLTAEVVDVNRMPALAREYGVRGVAFVLEVGGRRRVVSNPNEDGVVEAMLDLMRERPVRVGWVVGHGEGDLESGERRGGYAQLRRALELDHRDVRPVSLTDGGLGEDLDVVLIAAPRADFLRDELAVLDRYLEGGGALVVLLDSGRAPRLTAFLARYGVRLADDAVVDPASRLYGGEDVTIRLTLDQRNHPIVRTLAAPPLFSRARSVEVDDSVAGVVGSEFLHAGHGSFAVPRTAAAGGWRTRYDPARDRAGPIPVGAEVVRAVPGTPASRAARLVAFGSGEFANNFFLDFLGNKDVVLNAVAWLARDEIAMGHRTERQRPGVNQLFVSEAEGRRVYWIAVVLEPLLLGVVGVALLLRRRWR